MESIASPARDPLPSVQAKKVMSHEEAKKALDVSFQRFGGDEIDLLPAISRVEAALASMDVSMGSRACLRCRVSQQQCLYALFCLFVVLHYDNIFNIVVRVGQESTCSTIRAWWRGERALSDSESCSINSFFSCLGYYFCCS